MTSRTLLCVMCTLSMFTAVVVATYESGMPNHSFPCIYGYKFSVLPESEKVTECYTFDDASKYVEGTILSLEVYFPSEFVNNAYYSRCGECLVLVSTSGERYQAMIAGFHHGKDQKMIYGNSDMLNTLASVGAGIESVPLSFQFIGCPFTNPPKVYVNKTGDTVFIQPFNEAIPHTELVTVGSSNEYNTYQVDRNTGMYTVPSGVYEAVRTLKLVSIYRISVTFNLQQKDSFYTALTQFPKYKDTITTCQFIPENLLFEEGVSLHHYDPDFQWNLYRVTPSNRLKKVVTVNGEMSISFSTESITFVVGYPVYLQLNRFFSVFEFQYTSDCETSFNTADMFTLANTNRYHNETDVKCTNVVSLFKSREYKNEIGNTVLYGNLLKFNLDASCSSNVNFLRITLNGIIGGTITVHKMAFLNIEGTSVVSCNANATMCPGECSSPSEGVNPECVPFCGKCPAGQTCIDNHCGYITTNTRSSGASLFVVCCFLVLLLL